MYLRSKTEKERERWWTEKVENAQTQIPLPPPLTSLLAYLSRPSHRLLTAITLNAFRIDFGHDYCLLSLSFRVHLVILFPFYYSYFKDGIRSDRVSLLLDVRNSRCAGNGEKTEVSVVLLRIAFSNYISYCILCWSNCLETTFTYT